MVDRLPYDDNGHRTMLHDAKCGTDRHIHGLGGERVGRYDNLMIRYSSIEWLKDMTSCPA